MLILLAIACAPGSAVITDSPAFDSGTPPCADGFARAADGNCYPIAGGDTDTDTGSGDTDTDTGSGDTDTDTDTGSGDTGASLPDCSDPDTSDPSNTYGIGFYTGWSSSARVAWGGTTDMPLTGCLGNLAVRCVYGYVTGSFADTDLEMGGSTTLTLSAVSGSGAGYDYCYVGGQAMMNGSTYDYTDGYGIAVYIE